MTRRILIFCLMVAMISNCLIAIIAAYTFKPDVAANPYYDSSLRCVWQHSGNAVCKYFVQSHYITDKPIKVTRHAYPTVYKGLWTSFDIGQLQFLELPRMSTGTLWLPSTAQSISRGSIVEEYRCGIVTPWLVVQVSKRSGDRSESTGLRAVGINIVAFFFTTMVLTVAYFVLGMTYIRLQDLYRRNRQLCIRCRYCLRGVGDKCPECGFSNT